MTFDLSLETPSKDTARVPLDPGAGLVETAVIFPTLSAALSWLSLRTRTQGHAAIFARCVIAGALGHIMDPRH